MAKSIQPNTATFRTLIENDYIYIDKTECSTRLAI